jgi:DMSO/TMAO reductase YedYZ heme-binding membrane subunit
MRFVVGIIVSVAFVALLKKPIRRFPTLFYAIAIALDLFLIIGSSLHLPSWLREYFMFLLQSNNLAMGLFCIVMFTGVLKDGSGLRRVLVPIRAELSIIASILCVGHIVVYGRSYLEQLLSLSAAMPGERILATLIAFVLVLLLLPLTITSFKFVRSKMSPATWKRLQLLSYPFFVLIFAHVFFFLLPPALAGGSSAFISLIFYLAVAVTYLILRVRLYLQASQTVVAVPKDEFITS